MEIEDLSNSINEYLNNRKFEIKKEDTIFLAEIIEEFYSWRAGAKLSNNFNNKRELKNALKVFIERV